MINVTCLKCHWQFTVDEEAIAESHSEAEAPRPHHLVVECPRCRRANKVALRRRRRRRKVAKREQAAS